MLLVTPDQVAIKREPCDAAGEGGQSDEADEGFGTQETVAAVEGASAGKIQDAARADQTQEARGNVHDADEGFGSQETADSVETRKGRQNEEARGDQGVATQEAAKSEESDDSAGTEELDESDEADCFDVILMPEDPNKDIVNFGKHKGKKTYAQVFDEDPNYIYEWAVNIQDPTWKLKRLLVYAQSQDKSLLPSRKRKRDSIDSHENPAKRLRTREPHPDVKPDPEQDEKAVPEASVPKGSEKLGFGRYDSLTYREVFKEHFDQILWAACAWETAAESGKSVVVEPSVKLDQGVVENAGVKSDQGVAVDAGVIEDAPTIPVGSLLKLLRYAKRRILRSRRRKSLARAGKLVSTPKKSRKAMPAATPAAPAGKRPANAAQASTASASRALFTEEEKLERLRIRRMVAGWASRQIEFGWKHRGRTFEEVRVRDSDFCRFLMNDKYPANSWRDFLLYLEHFPPAPAPAPAPPKTL
jgi:hypothetical protein